MRTYKISIAKHGDTYNTHFEKTTIRENDGLGAFVTGGNYSTKEEAWRDIETHIENIDFHKDEVFLNKERMNTHDQLLKLVRTI